MQIFFLDGTQRRWVERDLLHFINIDFKQRKRLGLPLPTSLGHRTGDRVTRGECFTDEDLG